MSNPIQDLLSHMNRHLRRLGPDLSVEAEITVPAVLTFGPVKHETELRCRVTEDDVELVEPERQMRRIEQEIFDELTDGLDDYEYDAANAATNR